MIDTTLCNKKLVKTKTRVISESFPNNMANNDDEKKLEMECRRCGNPGFACDIRDDPDDNKFGLCGECDTPETTETKYIYEYDDKGVRCRHSEEDGWQPLEEHCLNCGERTGDCDCGHYRCGRWYCEETCEWQDADPETDAI